MTDAQVGPPLYENWLSFRGGAVPNLSFECPLFSDAYFTGEVASGLGPYELTNPLAVHDVGVVRPAIVLRYAQCLTHDPSTIDFSRTDSSRYHGASATEEMAALLSLSLGVRVRAGGATRLFDGGDPRGSPVLYSANENPGALHLRGVGPVLPEAFAERCINDAVLIPRFSGLEPREAVALIQAARQYQEALWVAEVQPEIAWIVLVSAIEVAASHWRPALEPPRDRLATSRPDLERVLLEAGGEELATRVADLLAPYMGATRKFLDFCVTFMPPEPDQRPPEYAAFVGRPDPDGVIEDHLRPSLTGSPWGNAIPHADV